MSKKEDLKKTSPIVIFYLPKSQSISEEMMVDLSIFRSNAPQKLDILLEEGHQSSNFKTIFNQ